jgi:putative transposase
LKVHLVWVPKYRKPVLTGDVAIRVRDLLRQIAMEHELEIVSGKVARDHVHLFVSYGPNQQVSQIMQWLKGISSRVLLQEFPQLRKKFWGRHFWGRAVLAQSAEPPDADPHVRWCGRGGGVTRPPMPIHEEGRR